MLADAFGQAIIGFAEVVCIIEPLIVHRHEAKKSRHCEPHGMRPSGAIGIDNAWIGNVEHRSGAHLVVKTIVPDAVGPLFQPFQPWPCRVDRSRLSIAAA